MADQMVQAATSRKSERKLTNVARASLGDELLRDYESFLRQNGLRVWLKDSREALAMRKRLAQDHAPELAANAMICAVNQAAYLLKRQLESQGETLVESGGFTERLYGARKQARRADQSDGLDLSDKSDGPACPVCGRPMLQRVARKGPNANRPFWGCSGYPDCRGALSAGASNHPVV